jgi:hypothetical protein
MNRIIFDNIQYSHKPRYVVQGPRANPSFRHLSDIFIKSKTIFIYAQTNLIYPHFMKLIEQKMQL